MAGRIRMAKQFFGPNRSAAHHRHWHIGAPLRLAKEPPMQRVVFVQYSTKPEATAENEALSRAVFTELRSRAPKDIVYALFRTPDRNGFVHLYVNLADDRSEPLTDLPSFKAFGAHASERQVAPPEVDRLNLELVDSYGLRAMAPA
jgi:hypothetical protein